MRRKNEYDYKKMMDDFDLETRRKKLHNGIRNKWSQLSKLYTEKVEEMKAKNERLYKERDRAFKKKIKLKEISRMKQLKIKNEKMMEDKKKAIEQGKRKCDDLMKNLEEYNKKQEEERLQLEKNTFLKCNLII